ncbi:hypothetical protein [Jiella pelagia]|uniref:hypothetical protein n=1 Tax=Jiella pelagia TaxID=2986949 RepID=UPI002E302D72|nr:hypothetical protein [Jiella pelagia]
MAGLGAGEPARISVTLRVIPGDYAISRLEPDAGIPDWADGPGFVSITRTAEEPLDPLRCRASAPRHPFGGGLAWLAVRRPIRLR